MSELLDSAARVLQMAEQLESVCTEMREFDSHGYWTTYQLAAQEAVGIASTGLRQSWVLLDRLHQLARMEVRRLKREN